MVLGVLSFKPELMSFRLILDFDFDCIEVDLLHVFSSGGSVTNGSEILHNFLGLLHEDGALFVSLVHDVTYWNRKVANSWLAEANEHLVINRAVKLWAEELLNRQRQLEFNHRGDVWV